MLQFLQSVDQFGIQQKLQVPPINPTQRSAVGGLVTFALYSASLTYFIYQIVDWQQNNKLPKYFSVQRQVYEHKQIETQDVLAEITYFQSSDQFIDPFDPNNLIFLPILLETPADWSKITKRPTEFVQEIQENGSVINKFLIKNVTFVGEPQVSRFNQQVDQQIYLIWCNQSNFTDSQFTCANEETVSKFFDQQNYFQFSFFLQQFDFKEKSLYKTQQTFFIDVVQGVVEYREYHLIINSLDIDDGFLFSTSRKLDYYTSVSVQGVQLDLNYSKRSFGVNAVAVLYLQIDQLMQESIIEYPKVSEILADTISIISFIMQVSFLVQKYNESLCIQQTKKEVIQMYYKDYDQFKIFKNWKGEILSISKANFIFKQKCVLEFFANLEKQALRKINYLNLQYEVSRLQLFIQKLLSFEQIGSFKKTTSSIGQLLQDRISVRSKPFQIQRNQIAPEQDDAKSNSQEDTFHLEDLEQDFMKTINLIVIEQEINQDHQELNNQNNELQENLNNEMQVVNLDSSSIELRQVDVG